VLLAAPQKPRGKPRRDPTGRHIDDPEWARAIGQLGGRPPKLTAEREGTHVEDVLRGYDLIEARLVAKHFPATSPWWRETIERWYRRRNVAGGIRQLVARVGRRGGKSSTLSRLAVAEALYGHHDVPPGDIGYVAVISTDRKEAAGRLRTIKAILDAVNVEHEPVEDTPQAIQIVGTRIGFRVFTASISGVSGFTAIFIICDEVAKWKDADTGANPASEVLTSVRPTIATMPNASIVLSSSPFGRLDAHFDAFEDGPNDTQETAFAPTWVSNPTLTEEATHALEPDEGAWKREFAAIPQAELESSLLTEALIDRATRVEAGDIPFIEGWTYVAAMDPATRANAWAFVITGQDLEGRRHVVLHRDWVPKPQLPLDPKAVLVEIHMLAALYALDVVFTDQHATEMLRALAPEGLLLVEAPWTVVTKREGYEHLLKLAQANRLGLPKDETVKADLLGIRKVITRSGVQYQLAEGRGGRHSDYAPAIALAVADARFIAIEIKREDPADKAKRERAERAQREQERPHWHAAGERRRYW
jgi:hypothetical protein